MGPTENPTNSIPAAFSQSGQFLCELDRIDHILATP
jgi:hypothetical protein